MLPYLDLFWTVIVLLETGTSGGEAAGGRRSVVGGIEVKMPSREVAWGPRLLSWLEAVQFGGEAAANCWAMGRLELTVPDGKAASARGEGLEEVWGSVTTEHRSACGRWHTVLTTEHRSAYGRWHTVLMTEHRSAHGRWHTVLTTEHRSAYGRWHTVLTTEHRSAYGRWHTVLTTEHRSAYNNNNNNDLLEKDDGTKNCIYKD